MKRSIVFYVVMALLAAALLAPSALFAAPKVTFFWALYDGLTEDYRASLEAAFNKANSDVQVQIVPVDWNSMQSKITTSLAGGAPPEISVIGTRWLLDYMATDSVSEVTSIVSKATINNIASGAMEAKIKGKLMGLPLVAGARILTVNNAITKVVPKTMEDLEAQAKRITKPGVYGLIMPGKKYTELTDFCYYFYAAGGDFFEMNADGSYGKSTVNSPAGVKALTFMAQLALKDKVVQDGFKSGDLDDPLQQDCWDEPADSPSINGKHAMSWHDFLLVFFGRSAVNKTGTHGQYIVATARRSTRTASRFCRLLEKKKVCVIEFGTIAYPTATLKANCIPLWEI